MEASRLLAAGFGETSMATLADIFDHGVASPYVLRFYVARWERPAGSDRAGGSGRIGRVAHSSVWTSSKPRP